MAKIVLPVRHSLYCIYGQNRTRRMLKAIEGMAFEIPEFSSRQARVVACLNIPWPVSGLPGQWDSDEENDNRFNTGSFDICHADGTFFAPVKRFSRMENIPAETVTIDDIGDIDNDRFRFASAFGSTFNYAISPSKFSEGRIICEGKENLSGDWDSLRIRDVFRDDRKRNSDFLGASLKYALIDGTLHLGLEDEPRIRFINYPHEVHITVEQYALIPPKLGGFFRLDRLEDCLEHVKAAYPGKPVRQWVKDLSVYDDATLRFRDEEEALRQTAWDIVKSMPRFGNTLDNDPEASRLLFKLGNIDLIKATEAELDDVSQILHHLAKLDLSRFNLDNREVEAAVSRWQVRPVERSFAPTP